MCIGLRILGLCWLAFSQAEATGSPFDAGLGYLLRHQDAEGAWGGAPKKCHCKVPLANPTPGITIPPGAKDRIKFLISSLSSDEIDHRTKAHHELMEIGEAAIEQLTEALTVQSNEVRLHCSDLLMEAERRRAHSDVETTAYVLLAFLLNGETAESRRTIRGLNIGEAVKRGMKWLIAQLNGDGQFGKESPEASSLASLVMCEYYSLTHNEAVKEAALRSLTYVRNCGCKSEEFLISKGLALRSCSNSRITEIDKREFLKITTELASIDSISAQINAEVFSGLGGQLADPVRANRIQRFSSEFSRSTPIVLGVLSLFEPSLWSRHGTKAFANSMDKFIRTAQDSREESCEYGSWEDGQLSARCKRTSIMFMLMFSATTCR